MEVLKYNMKVFITGGTGFIGTHLMKKLQNSDHEIMLLLLESEQLPNDFPGDFKTVTGNLSNIEKWKKQLEDFSPDATVHMAWEGIPDYSRKTSNKNLECGLKFIKTIAEIGCTSVICTGSCWEYGRKYGKLREEMKPVSTNDFTTAKNSLNVMGNEIAKENNMNFIWTRLFYVYGPLQRSYSLLPHIINSIQKGEKPEIKTPDTKNDFIFVEDAVDAISMILEKCKTSTVYNIGSGLSTSVRRIVEIVCKNFDFDYEIPQDDKSDISPTDFWADISKIKREIGWQPKTNINDGIEKTIKHYNKINLKVKEV